MGRSALAVSLFMGVICGADTPAPQTVAPEELRRLIDAQQKQIEQLQQALKEQKAQIDRILAAQSTPATAPAAETVAPVGRGGESARSLQPGG